MSKNDPTQDMNIDTDDYATTAVKDTPTSSRGEQSKSDFESQRATYAAKFENGNIYKSLPDLLPDPVVEGEKAKLGKKNIQLVTAAAGELYYFQRYDELLDLIKCVRTRYDWDADKGRFEANLVRWEGRCRDRMEKGTE